MEIITGGITSAKGFKATGAHIGIKKEKKDLAIISSDLPAVYAGTFTKNVVKAECVVWDQARFNADDQIYGIVINSGNANACTGEQGKLDNITMAQTLAKHLNCSKEQILTASTGVIGLPLNMKTVQSGIEETVIKLGDSYQDGQLAAEAIMTTDTFMKEIAVNIQIDGRQVTIGGMSKGSGMIHPNMATMLCFITTDITISKEMLQKATSEIVDDTFNMISVDGDTSTNDMVMVLANGASGAVIQSHDDYKTFYHGLNVVMQYLAEKIVQDGEGVTKVVEVQIKGAKDKDDAKLMAKSIIGSNLFKTAMFGSDANWGRILCAMGYSGANFNHETVSVKYISDVGELLVLKEGTPIKFDEEYALSVLSERDIIVAVELQEGTGQATAWGCDLSYEYVRINGEYRS